MNSVELQGRIQDIYVGRNVTIITLFIKGENGNNFPQIVFNPSERKLVECYKKNDFVNITGSIKVRGRKSPDGKQYFEQFIRGYIIYPVRSEMSEKFKKDLGGQFEYKNEVLIEGSITNLNDKNGVLNFMVKPNDEKFNVWLSNYLINPTKVMPKFVNGSTVCIKGEIQTSRKEKDGQKARFYENLIVKYMSSPKDSDSSNNKESFSEFLGES